MLGISNLINIGLLFANMLYLYVLAISMGYFLMLTVYFTIYLILSTYLSIQTVREDRKQRVDIQEPDEVWSDARNFKFDKYWVPGSEYALPVCSSHKEGLFSHANRHHTQENLMVDWSERSRTYSSPSKEKNYFV